MPVHVISPHGRQSLPKVRALLDFAVPVYAASSLNWPRIGPTTMLRQT